MVRFFGEQGPFGAANASFYRSEKAFRHGDIEAILSEMAKTAGHAAAGGGLLSLAQSVFSSATGGSKFSSQDVKRVYLVCGSFRFCGFGPHHLVLFAIGQLATRLFPGARHA